MADSKENRQFPENEAAGAGSTSNENCLRPSAAQIRQPTKGPDSPGSSGTCTRDIDRIQLVRERQNEERQRKLEELRQQALAAQRFREQREEERRKRIEELRTRDLDRRNQVEERKRLLWEAERERRESILRKNQEREARIEAKRKNERSHIVFAFGSSTPRMLEPADTGGASFWGTRRATSTSNVMMFSSAQPLTRRSSERELDGSKKRAISAGGLDRKPGEDMKMSSSMYEVFNWNCTSDTLIIPAKSKRASLSLPSKTTFSIDDIQQGTNGEENQMAYAVGAGTPSGSVVRYANRRRTDLVPTIPSPRELSGGPGSGRSSSAKSLTRSPGIRSGEVTPNSPSRPASSMSQQSGSTSVTSSSVNLRPRTGTPRRPRPVSIAGTGVSGGDASDRSRITTSEPKLQKDWKPPLPKQTTPKKSISLKPLVARRSTPRIMPLQSPGNEKSEKIAEPAREPENQLALSNQWQSDTKLGSEPDSETDINVEPKAEATAEINPESRTDSKVEQTTPHKMEKREEPQIEQIDNELSSKSTTETEFNVEEQCDMTASMIQRIRITTEEEAKAALAERRRLAREQAEREAELERLRQEEDARREAERLRVEEEEQRRLEEETLRLAQKAREVEEQRLKLAIEEAKRREEEDKKRREEEARQKHEKEEAERKAREEAEKQRLEMVERLKKEEEERNARRKRVEAIMSRTRSKTQANSSKNEGSEGEKLKDESPSEEGRVTHGEKLDQDLLTSNSISNSFMMNSSMTSSLIAEASQQLITNEQRAQISDTRVISNGMHANGMNKEDVGQQGVNGHDNTNYDNGIENIETIALDSATV